MTFFEHLLYIPGLFRVLGSVSDGNIPILQRKVLRLIEREQFAQLHIHDPDPGNLVAEPKP